MNWQEFKTHNESYERAFENLCNQLFERYLQRNFSNELTKFRVINGAGGDGGIEAYGQLKNENIIAIQSKWFRKSLQSGEFKQIKKSITSALDLRPNISEYIICIPHNLNSKKYGRGKEGEGKKLINKTEEDRVEEFTKQIRESFPRLEIKWWFEWNIEFELQYRNNEGVYKFWFENELLTIFYLKEQFDLQKKGWLNRRYVPELHGQGKINELYNKLCFTDEYRENYLTEYTNEIVIDLNKCIKLINDFQQTVEISSFISKRLEVIKRNLNLFVEGFKNTITAILEGNDYYRPNKIREVWIWRTLMILEDIKPSNNQKGILPKLTSLLREIHKHDLENTYFNRWEYFEQGIILILGEAGTGKTHGLANCVDFHLSQDSPAILIQAKGTPCQSWSSILSTVLKLNNWNEDSIFNALNSLAIRRDNQIAQSMHEGEEPKFEHTKALICIDGLDEDFIHKEDWYSRLRECEIFLSKYPRLRFMFSARRYFYNNTQVPDRGIYDEIFLAREGDVSIYEVAPKYFSKEYYNIEITSYSLIKGIDSLYALRLFCEEYQGKQLNEESNIKSATKDLLNAKIERMNDEFISSLSPKRISSINNPVKKSLKVISTYFYNNLNVNHDALFKLIYPEVENILDKNEVNLLIEKFVNDGILLNYYESGDSDILDDPLRIYNITYQSIVEHIISEQVFLDIKSGKIKKIPDILFKGMVRPLDYVFKQEDFLKVRSYNQQIIQNIINSIFIETGKLIGIDNYLTKGFSPEEIFELQMNALIIAPDTLAIKFKPNVDQMFFGGFENQFKIVKFLIIPSSRFGKHPFGAEYLHRILMDQVSCFERDKLWSGLDRFELRNLSEEARWRYNFNNLKSLFDENHFGIIHLNEVYNHNELPLVYAWGLSTIDQKLRDLLRIALTGWAIENPKEFKLLLDKIFDCNDPQIQEDLASIMLGVASRLTEKVSLLELAGWAIHHIFSNTEKFRNVIIRQGFRTIVERAFMYGLISKNEVEKCRPKRKRTLKFLPLDKDYLETTKEEHYPIVHDLAWYVIHYAYNDFLDTDCKEATRLLDEYEKAYSLEHIYRHAWAMGAAISYIKFLGLTRKHGNGFTDATHGSKSDVFTYEEKYTWLAVHYLQGYLADYIPIRHWSWERITVKDYTQITDIPNPAEKVTDWDYMDRKFDFNSEWVIKENLAEEFSNSTNLEEAITNWVNTESMIDFNKWLIFDENDIQRDYQSSKWVSLYHHCGLHDSNEYVYSYFDAKACLIANEDFNSLKEIIEVNPDRLNFILSLDSLHSTPQTNTYCNPSDIVWMSWIEEDGAEDSFNDLNNSKERKLYISLAKVIQMTIDGENYFMLPSKKLRNLLDCFNLKNDELIDINDNVIGFLFEKDKGHFKGNQEILLIDYDKLNEKLEHEDLKLVWFIENLKQRNYTNDSFKKDFRAQKVRKYFVWLENNEFEKIEFWEETFSNQRD